MGKKGKGRKRREANFKASHPDAMPRLAPPPDLKDINAVPAKLRKIMQFKEIGNLVNKHSGATIGHSKNQGKDFKDSKEKKVGAPGTKVDDKKAAPASNNPTQGTVNGEAAEETPKPLSKRKREHEELLQLAEKIKAPSARAGISEKRKKYLEEKKKKKLKNSDVQALLNQPKRDHVKFGDIVQAPPELSFPERNKNKVGSLCQCRF
nr:uncharacterized protein LOC112274813 isoform X2 [Physcomitrium patens]|eukprot:XP_024360353.1 uncharacterized protein LOC112274813 isoform X2 [Physcomitrella patens]